VPLRGDVGNRNLFGGVRLGYRNVLGLQHTRVLGMLTERSPACSMTHLGIIVSWLHGSASTSTKQITYVQVLLVTVRRDLTMVCNTQNYWRFGHCPSSGILKTLKNTAFRKLDLFPSSSFFIVEKIL
jgi:hypothetical protein